MQKLCFLIQLILILKAGGSEASCTDDFIEAENTLFGVHVFANFEVFSKFLEHSLSIVTRILDFNIYGVPDNQEIIED